MAGIGTHPRFLLSLAHAGTQLLVGDMDKRVGQAELDWPKHLLIITIPRNIFTLLPGILLFRASPCAEIG